MLTYNYEIYQITNQSCNKRIGTDISGESEKKLSRAPSSETVFYEHRVKVKEVS